MDFRKVIIYRLFLRNYLGCILGKIKIERKKVIEKRIIWI